MSEEERKSYEILYGKIMFVDKYRFLKPHWIKFHNYTEKLQKEIEEKTTIIMAGAEKVKQLEKENKELKEKVFKRDKELIRLEEYANQNFERKDDVKAKYIPKEKIREYIKEKEEEKEGVKNISLEEYAITSKELKESEICLLKCLLEEE